ncbi:MAG: hypothetical protein HW421_1291 [Ignavibacteria bacterium]|nr:hypothetical protein [Ignavibacteria bacterium]
MEETLKRKNLFVSILLAGLSVTVVLMLSSFLFRTVISPPVDPNLDDNIQKNTVEEVIQVNVLNASGVQGLAARVRNFLRARGFDVVEIGNYPESSENSIIIDKVGDVNSALKVAYALGIGDTLVTTKIDSALFLRTSIIIGKDFASLKPFK